MQLRRLGSSNLQVSAIGLGLAALGRPGYINLGHAQDLAGTTAVPALEAHAHAVLDHAWRAGIRYYDAARSYGLAEVFLASWLRARQIPPAEVTLGSKWGYVYTAGWQAQAEVHEVKQHSLSMLQLQWAESQAILGSYLQLYQIHSATLESEVLEDQAILAELARLKQAGIALGLSASGPRQAEIVRRALAISVDGRQLFDTLQVTWNLLERSAGPALAEAHAAGVGIIVKEALANGRLTSRNSEPGFAPQRRLLEQQAARLGSSVDALALAGVLAQPWAGVVLSGAADSDQLQSNLQALQVAWDEQAGAALDSIAEPPERYWQTRKQLAWN